MSHEKIFGIGLSKTGTTSLTTALTILGYRSIHYPPADELDAILRTHDAATDTSVACQFESLDERYPNSKFILTWRDPSDWMISARREFENRPVSLAWKREVRTRIYGSADWDADLFGRMYDRFNRRVRAYFSNRPHSLLTMNIIAGDGWAPLCGFLGKAVPIVPFPHDNASTRRTSTDQG